MKRDTNFEKIARRKRAGFKSTTALAQLERASTYNAMNFSEISVTLHHFIKRVIAKYLVDLVFLSQ